MRVRTLIKELMRRRVVPVAAYYVGFAWVILQVGDVAQEAWELAPVTLQYLWIVLGIGFPIALMMSWIYDITPQGIVETKSLKSAMSFRATEWGLKTIVEPEEADADAIVCPICKRPNRQGSRFCIDCGTALEKPCPACGVVQVSGVRHCAHCGLLLGSLAEDRAERIDKESTTEALSASASSVQEKRHVCVACVRINATQPGTSEIEEEEQLERLSNLVQRVEKIANRFGGQIETLSDHTVCVLFGLINAYEHDAISAVRTALDVSKLMDHRSPVRLGGIGISSGFVLTRNQGDAGRSSAPLGAAMRRANAIAELAEDHEVLVASAIFDQTINYFDFESSKISFQDASGKEQLLYVALDDKDEITTVHRASGRQSPLIGREQELSILNASLQRLERGKGSIVTIVGAAGTGKSRLVAEFKAQIKPGLVQFYEGHAFSYTRNTPYFPVCDLMKKIWDIRDSDSLDTVQTKLQSGASGLFGAGSSMIPYIAMLFGIVDEEQKQDSPEVINIRLKRSLISVLSAISAIRPTVFFIEDLHWADSASVEMIRFAIRELRYPALLVCTHRPQFSLVDDSARHDLAGAYQTIQLQDLSNSEAAEMTGRLFEGESIPEDFLEFVGNEAEGNPFYIEEIVNSALEAEILVPDEGGWRLTQPLRDLKIPTTIYGIINERVQRLDQVTREVLQEAAVIGRVFSVRLLQAINQHPENIGACIQQLEQLGMIRVNPVAAGNEYFFNHVMTQEVVYDGLLRKTCQNIHERIGRAAEILYADRLSESSEMLAYHFKSGTSSEKAVKYLLAAAAKSWHRYSLGEAHDHFREAYYILKNKVEPSPDNRLQLLGLIDQWAIVFNHRGDYISLRKLLDEHEDLAVSMQENHPRAAAMYFGWKGYALQCAESLRESYEYLQRALKLAQRSRSDKATAYVCAWLGRTATDMGKLDEAIYHCNQAWEIAGRLETDSKLFRFIWSAMGLAHYFRGDRAQVEEVVKVTREFAEVNSDLRALLLSYVNKGCSFLLAGDYPRAAIEFQRGASLSVDPMYVMYARLMYGVTLASAGKLAEAENVLTQVIEYDKEFGFNLLGTTAKGMMSIVLLSRGHLAEGVAQAEDVLEIYRAHGSRFRYCHQQHLLGSFYLKLVLKEGPSSLSFLAKNATFLVRNIRHARNKAELHFQKAVESAKLIGAQGVLGQSWLDLGRLYAAENELHRASESLEMAIEIFETTDATEFLAKTIDEVGLLELTDKIATSGG
jgi:tetratricopeptide (TPR) repeat protein/class 3 adenylate cyclase